MADIVNGIQINKLPEATSVADEDILILENAERTQKVSVGTLRQNVDTQGVNIYTGTKDFSGDRWKTNSGTNLNAFTVEMKKYNDLTVLSKSVAWNFPFQNIQAKKGETYTLSLFAKSESGAICQFSSSEGDVTNFTISSIWTRYHYTHTCVKDGNFGISFDSREDKKVYICGYKLERGTVTDPIWTPAPEDLVVKSDLSPSLLNLVFPKNAAAHNAIFRGKNLTSIYTVKQICDMISKGTFDDLFIGDFFDVTISTSFTQTETVRCVFAGFDMYLKNGDTDLRKHHAVIVPKNCFTATAKMNSTNTTGISENPENPVGNTAGSDAQKGAYLGCDLHQLVLPVYATALQKPLENHILTYKDLLSNKQSASGSSMAGAGYTGYASGWEWASVQLRLMSEVQVYGTTVFSSSFFDVGAANLQLPLFQLDPTAKVAGLGGTGDGRQWYWLSAVASTAYFAYVDYRGHSNYGSASYGLGVRPLFLIG